MIGSVSVLSASTQMHSLRKHNRERTLAQNAMRSMAERIHAASHGFSDDPNTWASSVLALYGPGGTQVSFAVEGLTLPQGADFVGAITVLTNETLNDTGLNVELGLPRDLNADGDDDDVDVSGNARILPVVLTLRWSGESGTLTMRHGFYLLGY